MAECKDCIHFEVCAYASHDLPVCDSFATSVMSVVRCRECLYAREKYGHIECLNGISYRNTYNDPDMFCSYGQRRESEK